MLMWFTKKVATINKTLVVFFKDVVATTASRYPEISKIYPVYVLCRYRNIKVAVRGTIKLVTNAFEIELVEKI